MRGHRRIFNGEHDPHMICNKQYLYRAALCAAMCSSSTAPELGGCRGKTDKKADQLEVTAIQSAGDAHEIKELNNSAGVGALCVAVVRQSLTEVSREIWDTTRGGAAMANKKTPLLVGEPTGASSTSAAAGALRALLRRYAQAFAPRGGEGVQTCSEACLVLYCKLAGGVVMTSPLDGPAFRLRRHPIVEDVEDDEALAREVRERRGW